MKYSDMLVSDVTAEVLEDIVETSVDNLRKNNDGTRAVVKWKGEDPAWVSSLGLTVRTHEEAIAFYVPANGWGQEIPG